MFEIQICQRKLTQTKNKIRMILHLLYGEYAWSMPCAKHQKLSQIYIPHMTNHKTDKMKEQEQQNTKKHQPTHDSISGVSSIRVHSLNFCHIFIVYIYTFVSLLLHFNIVIRNTVAWNKMFLFDTSYNILHMQYWNSNHVNRKSLGKALPHIDTHEKAKKVENVSRNIM